jgi:hypothetical protein
VTVVLNTLICSNLRPVERVARAGCWTAWAVAVACTEASPAPLSTLIWECAASWCPLVMQVLRNMLAVMRLLAVAKPAAASAGLELLLEQRREQGIRVAEAPMTQQQVWRTALFMIASLTTCLVEQPWQPRMCRPQLNHDDNLVTSLGICTGGCTSAVGCRSRHTTPRLRRPTWRCRPPGSACRRSCSGSSPSCWAPPPPPPTQPQVRTSPMCMSACLRHSDRRAL